MTTKLTTWDVLADVRAERVRQDAKFGVQNHPDLDPRDNSLSQFERDQEAHQAKRQCEYRTQDGTLGWEHVLTEEVLEAYAARTPEELRAELIQVAAVAVAWVECIDRRRTAPDAIIVDNVIPNPRYYIGTATNPTPKAEP